MMKFSSEKYKSILIQTVVELDRVCNEYGLRYYLVGGSLIGAVRHKGMIPWDDDIDVAMPRKDLEQLKEIAPTAFNADYELVDYHRDGYWCRYTKLYNKRTTVVENKYNFYVGGVWVDVFALDGVPGNKHEACRYYEKHYAPNWYRLYSLYKPAHIVMGGGVRDFARSVRDCFRHIIYDRRSLIQKLEKVASKHEFETSEWVLIFQGAWGLKEIARREYFDEYLLMEFEGYKLRVPKGYDAYLKGVYGDYMTLPPVDKRESHHELFFVDLERRLTKKEILAQLQ